MALHSLAQSPSTDQARVRGRAVRPIARAARSALEQLEQRRLLAASIDINGLEVHPTEGAPFSGEVATFTHNGLAANAADFSATINWGDGATSPGDGHAVMVMSDPNIAGQFDVVGSHTYGEESSFPIDVTVVDTVDQSAATTSSYVQDNLVTNDQTHLANLGFAPAAHTDANLVNPWGIAFGSTGPFWVGDNGQGVATLYDGNGNAQALVVTIPASANPGATSPAPVTGVVFNGSSTDFDVAGAGTSAHFIFATEDGTIAGWSSGTSAVIKVDNNNFVTGPVYKGIAIANNGTANRLYATNFRAGTVDLFDTSFAPVLTLADPTIPAGFAPFGIENIGGKLFVTFAKQDASKHDDVSGAGNGFVDVLDPATNTFTRLITQGHLNSPWGLTLAPTTFGPFANDLLVGDFGDGKINAYDSTTGAFLGQLNDSHNQPIAIDGLWGLSFGNNGTAGPKGTLFFTAGINGEADGLFGRLTSDVSAKAVVADAALLPGNAGSTTGTSFSGVGGTNASTTAGTANAALQAFEAGIGGVNNGAAPPPQATGFRAINWDGVALDGTDFGGDTTVIDPNHVVGIPTNRFQERGINFDAVYAVSGPASASDSSTFSTVNPSVLNLFNAFSPTKTFAMFNDKTIDFSFSLASAHTTTPVPAESRGFGAIFKNVEIANTTSIEYFHNGTSLGKFFVPVGSVGQAEFFGELFNSSIVTNVTITLGTDALFSFDGTHFSAGPQTDDPAHGHNLVVTDDFVYAEPVALDPGQPDVSATEGTPFSGAVATFSDLDPNSVASDYTATINWGDGHQTPGTIASNGSGGFNVSGTNTFGDEGVVPISVLVQDFGGAELTLHNSADVADAPVQITGGFNIDASEGEQFSGPVSGFTNPGSSDSANEFTALINWGDGATTPGTITGGNGSFVVSGTHTYQEEGEFPVSVQVIEIGQTPSADTPVVFSQIVDAPLDANGINLTDTEGHSFSNRNVARFTDANPLAGNDLDDFSATIQWGDGTSSSGKIVPDGSGGFFVRGSHQYKGEKIFNTKITIKDDGGSSATASGTAHINEAPLTGFSITFNAKHGATFSGKVGAFADADPFNTDPGNYAITIDWGDGTSKTTGKAKFNTSTHHWDISGSHKYAKKSPSSGFKVKITVVDAGPPGIASVSAIINSTAKVS
jgi:uncharacterized protein (TIGR03118 family)